MLQGIYLTVKHVVGYSRNLYLYIAENADQPKFSFEEHEDYYYS